MPESSGFPMYLWTQAVGVEKLSGVALKLELETGV
jgi:hypothetical protein